MAFAEGKDKKKRCYSYRVLRWLRRARSDNREAVISPGQAGLGASSSGVRRHSYLRKDALRVRITRERSWVIWVLGVRKWEESDIQYEGTQV